jgi:hypothetical protein
MRANALADGRACGERTRSGRFRLTHAAERHGAKRRKRAAGQAGLAQEAAAVETAGLARKEFGDGTSAIGTLVCSLDKHGSLPLRPDND